MVMEFDWDERKRALNLEKHGLDFADVASLAWETARVLVDDRRDYGEVRYRAVGLYKDQPHFVAFTLRDEKIRVISFRKAHAKEARLYGKQK
jgi:uncharacterized DUF497 family protein